MAKPSPHHGPTCPRCSTPDASLVACSPVKAVWEMHLCSTCFYSWRSTEPDYATRAESLATLFRIDPAGIPLGKPMPTVPPLRTQE